MTPAEEREINRRAFERSHDLLGHIRAPSGRPQGLAISLNPSSTRHLRRVMFVTPAGAWVDQEGGSDGGRGDDVIDLVAWQADVSREEAALGLRDWLNRLPPLAPNVGELIAERHGLARPAEPAPPMAPTHRSLRRG